MIFRFIEIDDTIVSNLVDRLEGLMLYGELCNNFQICKQKFLRLLNAIVVAKQPLPLAFVTRILCSGDPSLVAQQSVMKAISCISTLLPIINHNLKCPYDQIFGSPHFYIFVKSMTFLLNLSNFKSLRAWKVTFFDGFYTRLYSRH